MPLPGPESLTKGGRILGSFFWNYGTLYIVLEIMAPTAESLSVSISTSTLDHLLVPIGQSFSHMPSISLRDFVRSGYCDH